MVQREGIELTGAFAATVDADLKVGSLEETVTVSGESPTVDVQSSRRSNVIPTEVIDALPTSKSIHHGGAPSGGYTRWRRRGG